jgi:hypothetical protein
VTQPGDAVGPYRLVARLGKGAMGEVWRARDERLDRMVAVKLLPADLAADAERRARMIREARAAAAVPHPNVVTLFDVVSDGDRDVLVMELVEGQTVAELLRASGPPPLPEALGWLEKLADALAAAHARGILHRDVKAANVMVTAGREVKVLDFGLAKLRGDAAPVAEGAPLQPRLPSASASMQKIAMDETMPSDLGKTASGSGSGTDPPDAYVTRAGALLGTPMYMAPEQITGSPPDERTEVFSVGVIAYELLCGKPPYTATMMDELFAQITTQEAPRLAGVPADVDAVVARALAKDPAARWPTMAALRDALVELRHKRSARRRWPVVVGFAAAIAATAVAAVILTREDAAPAHPGDAYVTRALEEYDVFYNDKALSSLRAALRLAPDHPRANAYLILFGGAPAADRTAAAAGADRANTATAARGKDRALLEGAIALERRGPRAAREAMRAVGAAPDRELAFWAAELAYRAGDHATARAELGALLADPAPRFRGRIYDHLSAVLLYLDEPAEAQRIGQLYRDAFPGEADAVAVHATTLAAAGRLDEALAAAELALALAEGEDTLAGLGKVRAMRGERDEARRLYRMSLERAGPARRPLRRAALALLEWMDGDVAGARETVLPCLPAEPPRPTVRALEGTDAAARERGACLFVAGALDPALAPVAAAELDRLAAEASDLAPAYGAPDRLAALVRARGTFFAGGCVIPGVTPVPPADPAAVEAMLAGPVDFYASYHVPYFATWATCELAALAAATGDRAKARAVLQPVAERAPGRTWLLDDLTLYR